MRRCCDSSQKSLSTSRDNFHWSQIAKNYPRNETIVNHNFRLKQSHATIHKSSLCRPSVLLDLFNVKVVEKVKVKHFLLFLDPHLQLLLPQLKVVRTF